MTIWVRSLYLFTGTNNTTASKIFAVRTYMSHMMHGITKDKLLANVTCVHIQGYKNIIISGSS